MHRECAPKNKQWEKQPDGLTKLSMQGKKAMLCRKVVKFPSSSQTGLVFPNLVLPTKIRSAQGSFFFDTFFTWYLERLLARNKFLLSSLSILQASHYNRIARTHSKRLIATEGEKKSEIHTPLASTARDTIRLIELIIYLNKYNSYFISAAFCNVFLVCWSNFPESH